MNFMKNKYIFKSKVKNHQEKKEKLLQQIALIPQNPFKIETNHIQHTDWNLPATMHREYKSLFIETISDHLVNMCNELNLNNYLIGNFWFQQYGENNHHGWHTHPYSNFANVYFLECPKGMSTKFKDFTEECEEGDILSFPAFLPHMSPPIKGNNRKTIIAFNTDFNIVENK